MNDEKSQNVDLLGIQPIADSINIVTKTASEFLNIICRPAAEEFGFLLQDRVRYWRIKNFSNITIKAERILRSQNDEIDLSASPRIVYNILENGSWIDDAGIQKMWGGLLASACTREGKDESNLIFINLLSQLTHSEVKILNYICKNANKRQTKNGLVFAQNFKLDLEILKQITGLVDIHLLDRELDHLRSFDLITLYSGFIIEDEDNKSSETSEDIKLSETPEDIEITPTSLALNMYVRCNGSLQTPVEYFDKINKIPKHPT
jgi:hypothetical protein